MTGVHFLTGGVEIFLCHHVHIGSKANLAFCPVANRCAFPRPEWTEYGSGRSTPSSVMVKNVCSFNTGRAFILIVLAWLTL
jgi:hypothetical protein